MASMFVPQLVTPVDTSFLRDIGNTIGGLKQDSEIADILKGIDPYDPNSKQRVINDLRQHSKEGRDMADRMEGLEIRRQTANQQGEYQRGQLDVHRGQLGVQQSDLTLRQEEAKRLRENRGEIQRGLERFGQGGPQVGDAPLGTAVPPVVPREERPPNPYFQRAPGAPAPRPSSSAQPLMKPVASAAPETEEPTLAAPSPTAAAAPTRTAALAAPMGGAAVSDARGAAPAAAGFNEPVPGQPAVQRAGALLGGGAAGAPAPAVPAAPVRTAQGAPAVMAAPAARVPTLPPAGMPVAPEEKVGAEEVRLRQEVKFLNALLAKADDPAQREAIKAMRDSKKSDLDAITSVRTEAEKEVGKARAKIQETTNVEETKERMKMVMDYGQRGVQAADVDNNLSLLQRTIDSPNYQPGMTAYPRMWAGSIVTELNDVSKKLTGYGLENVLGEDMVENWITDPTARLRTMHSTMNNVTRMMLGGSLSYGVSVSDREFVKEENVGITDTKESARRLILKARAAAERTKALRDIVVSGARDGYSATEIQEALGRYADENPVFVSKDGTLTPLGREIAPTKAKEEDKRLQARNERAAKAGEEFRDTSGAGEAAVIGYRPSEAEKKAVREREGRPTREDRVRDVGPARAATEAATEAVGARLPSLGGAQAGARELLRGDNPATRFFQGAGRPTYGAEGVGGLAGVPPRSLPPIAPQRLVGEDISDINYGYNPTNNPSRNPFGTQSVERVWTQAPRVPIESMRPSTNVEDRTGETTPEQMIARNPALRSDAAFRNWQQESDRQRYAEWATPNPYPEMAREAGLADLERPGYISDLRKRNLARDRGMGSELFAGPTLPPLPPPSGRQSKATEEAERRRRDRRTPR